MQLKILCLKFECVNADWEITSYMEGIDMNTEDDYKGQRR